MQEEHKFAKQNQKVFEKAKTLITWNKYLMTPLGLWPNNRKDYIFVSFFCYYGYNVLLDYVALFFTIRNSNLMRIVGKVMENVQHMHIFLRMYTMRRFNRDYGDILVEFSKDFSIKNYRSEEERNTFLYYNSRAKFFIRIVVISLVITATLYFIKPLIRQLS